MGFLLSSKLLKEPAYTIWMFACLKLRLGGSHNKYWENLSNTDLSSLRNNEYSFWPTLRGCAINKFIPLSFETSWCSEKCYRHLPCSSSCYHLSIYFQNIESLDLYTLTFFALLNFPRIIGALKVTAYIIKTLIYVMRLKLCCHLDLR